MTEKEHDPLSTPLLVIAIICSIIGLFPQGGGHTDPKTNQQITEWTLGFNFSPFWRYNKRESPDGSFHSESKVNFFSWSSVLLVVGAVALEVRTRRRRKRKKG